MAPLPFWEALDAVVATSQIVIDRPRGTAHPRYPDVVYPLDYGYLAGTTSGDGAGIDVWLGSDAARQVTAIIVTVDRAKRDSEIKLLVDCTSEEQQTILAFQTSGAQSALLVPRQTGQTVEMPPSDAV
jgi:inorganic pyrophosphatase